LSVATIHTFVSSNQLAYVLFSAENTCLLLEKEKENWGERKTEKKNDKSSY
jgi:hypothetical protein